MAKNIFLCCFMSLLTISCMHKTETPNVSNIDNPLDVVKLVGDKLIRDTPFKYCLVLANPGKQFASMQTIDFTRTFGAGKQGLAYAFTQLNSTEKMDQQIELEHSDGCRIWLNGKLIYDFPGKERPYLRKKNAA